MKQHLLTASLCLFALTSLYSQKTASAKQKPVTATAAKPATISGKVVYGKYGCSASKYRGGSYEFQPKGAFVLNKNGTYAYHGFEKPSTGTFTVDATGVVHFSGGYFNGGEATPMQDRPNRYYVVFPANPDNRWTCSLMNGK